MHLPTSCRSVLLSCLVLAFAAGCGGDDEPGLQDDPDAAAPLDAGGTQPGPRDASAPDAAKPDAAADASAPDAGEPDAGEPDAGPIEECVGEEDGAPCGEIPSVTSCIRAYACQAEACQPVFAVEGASCGASVEGTCDLPDTCDDAGTCIARFAVIDTPCGDDALSDCNAPDSCDGAGACRPNLAVEGTACGDAAASQCNAADTCDALGACAANTTPDGVACYDCGAGVGACTSCSGSACAVRAGRCVAETTQLSTTTMAGNNHRGNMFDLTALHTVTIESFDAFPMGNTTMEVYYRPGTYVGFEGNVAGWTMLGSAPIVAQGGLVPVAVPVRVTIPEGETYGFYVTSTQTGVSLNYSNGNAVGAPYTSDANLVFKEGGGLEYPFTGGTGAVYQPRIFNGAIHYSTGTASLDATAAPYAGATARGAMFDLQAIGQARVGTLGLELAAGVQDLTVYFRRGTFVGHEASSAGWQPLATQLAVDSAGGGALTLVRFADAIELEANETVGLYVDAQQADRLRVTAGGAVGDEATSNAALRLRVGTALGGSFEAPGTPAAIRGVLSNPVCLQP